MKTTSVRKGLSAFVRSVSIFGATSSIVPLSAQQPPVAKSQSTMPDMPTFWIPDDGSGWIDFTPSESGHIVIPVVLDGEPVRALVDTGVPQMLISKAFADDHHLPLTAWGRTNNFGGVSDNYIAPITGLTIGALRLTKPGVIQVTDISSFAGLGPERFDVVIGLSLLGALGWEVDQDHHRFRFVRSGSIAVDHPIPIRLAKSRLFADVSLAGRDISPVMIDTGSDDQVSLTVALAETLGFHGQTDLAAAGVGGRVVRPFGQVRDFRIGDRVVPAAYARVGDDWYEPEGARAMIGMGILGNYNIVADPPAGKMALISRATPLPPFRKSTSGVQGPYHDGRVTIMHVMKNSPAASIGLKAGDEICAIDGKPMSKDMDDRHWRLAAPGTRYRLKLCDGSDHVMTLRSFY